MMEYLENLTKEGQISKTIVLNRKPIKLFFQHYVKKYQYIAY